MVVVDSLLGLLLLKVVYSRPRVRLTERPHNPHSLISHPKNLNRKIAWTDAKEKLRPGAEEQLSSLIKKCLVKGGLREHSLDLDFVSNIA